MESQTARMQITFYYVNGQTESFNVYDPIDAHAVQQEVQQELRRIMEKHWWILNLPDQTVCVNTTNILKVEIKPPISRIQGEGVFENAERVTTLRAHSHHQ